MRTFITRGAIACTAVTLTLPAMAQEVVAIGHSAPLTGPQAATARTMKMALEWLSTN